MNSPTPCSESNLRRYKGIRASKKSANSCADFYTKKETTTDVDGKNNNRDRDHVGVCGAAVVTGGGSGVQEGLALGPRSVSLSALVTRTSPSAAQTTTTTTEEVDQTSPSVPLSVSRPQSAILEPARMLQLETLEAKMASIEVSLSNLQGLPRRRNGYRSSGGGGGGGGSGVGTRSLHSGSVCTITNGNCSSGGGGGGGSGSVNLNSNYAHSHGHNHNHSHSSGRSHHHSGSGGGGVGGPKDIHHYKELEVLRQSVKDKEHLILNLQAQLRKLSKRKLVHGSITSTDSGVVSLRILSESERKGAEERLAQLDKDMEVKRAEIKRINHRLERLDPSDNIDVRIQQAELEYELEREELNLMNLQEERRNLHTILDDNDAFQKLNENSLFMSMPENSYVGLHSFEVMYDAQDPSFHVGKREDRVGTYVTWTREDLKTLRRGDRIVEINGTMVISKGVNRVDEFWTDDAESHSGGSNSSHSGNGTDEYGHHSYNNGSGDGSLGGGCHSLRLVIMRAPSPPPPPRVPNKEVHMLKEELALVSNKLEQVNIEKRELGLLCQKLQKEHKLWEDETEKFRTISEKIVKERDNLRTESVRLKHRISYLEEQVADLLHKKDIQLQYPQPVTVFQKGNRRAIVAEPVKSTKEKFFRSNSPTSVASTTAKSSESRHPLKTRLWETFRRATTSDSRSVCSVETSRHHSTENGYFKKRSSESKKLSKSTSNNNNLCASNKPEPPTKPVRLSLQRATSTANVYSPIEVPEMNPGLRRSNYSENTLLPDWTPPDDLRSETSEKKSRSHGKHGGIRWPSLRPASSMSYTMSNRNCQLAKF